MDIPTSITLVRRRHEGAKQKQITIQVPGPALGFRVQKRGRLHLVLPDRKTIWNDDTRWFRSMVFDRDGAVVSAGLPKFMSPGRDRATWLDLMEADADPELRARVRIYEKLDGSLIIRSVHRGEVLWRTRGSFDLGSFSSRVNAWVNEHCPALNDPTFAPDLSMHFEWQDRSNRVVVIHTHDELTLLAAQANESLQQLDRSAVQALADEATVPIVREIAYEGLLSDLPEWVDQEFSAGGSFGLREGIICVFEDERGRPQRRLRIKGEWYRLQHAMRYDHNPQAVLRAWERVSRKNPKGKAKKRARAADPVDAVLNELNITQPALQAWVRQICEGLAELDVDIEAEWQRLLALHKTAGEDVGAKAARRLGLDPIAASVFRNLGKKQGKAKSQLVQSRRADLMQRLAL